MLVGGSELGKDEVHDVIKQSWPEAWGLTHPPFRKIVPWFGREAALTLSRWSAKCLASYPMATV